MFLQLVVSPKNLLTLQTKVSSAFVYTDMLVILTFSIKPFTTEVTSVRELSLMLANVIPQSYFALVCFTAVFAGMIQTSLGFDSCCGVGHLKK